MTISQQQMRELEALVQRLVTDAIAAQRKVPSPNENYSAWYLTVAQETEASLAPVRGINKIVYNDGTVSYPDDNTARVDNGGGGGGGAFVWILNNYDAGYQFGSFGAKGIVTAATTLSTVRWSTDGDFDIYFSVGATDYPTGPTPINMTGSGSQALAASLSAGDEIEVTFVANTVGDMTLVWV